MSLSSEWLQRNKGAFGSHDGLPGAFWRECMFNAIRVGKQVAIVTPHGSVLQGRAVMRGPAGWVLNLGGAHGTPGIADERNTVWVVGVMVKGGTTLVLP